MYCYRSDTSGTIENFKLCTIESVKRDNPIDMTTKEDNMGYYMHPLLLKLPGYILESQPIEFANDVKLQWEVTCLL